VRRPTPRPTPPPPATATIAEGTTTVPPSTLTIAPTTTAPTTAPVTATVPPAVVTTTQPATTTVAQTPVTITPPVSVPASGDRARYDALAREFAANPRGNFTVQIQILCDPGNVGAAMRAGGNSVWFVPQTIGGRSCYRLFWGNFQTREEAQRAMAQIPAALRDRSAAVKPVPR
jgi:septal ring-binding cell division protein DamX